MLRRHTTTYEYSGRRVIGTWWQFGSRVWRFRERMI
jgi:hypothetical protein